MVRPITANIIVSFVNAPCLLGSEEDLTSKSIHITCNRMHYSCKVIVFKFNSAECSLQDGKIQFCATVYLLSVTNDQPIPASKI